MNTCMHLFEYSFWQFTVAAVDTRHGQYGPIARLFGCQNVVEMPIAKQLHFGYFAVKSGISMAGN